MANLKSAREWARGHLLSLAILIIIIIVSAWAVEHFKRPGQMTVIESQAMDMTSMKPPVGSVPVAIEAVKRTPFQSMLRYSGTVVSFNEQDIYPRIDGRLTGLKVYDGDTVQAGQLLAVLDGADGSSSRPAVAQSQAEQMRAEKAAAESMTVSAASEVKGAEARLTAAKKSAEQAAADLASAKATHDYWKGEFKRQEALYKEGAVSKQEYDSELSQLKAAEANVVNKKAGVDAANAGVKAAKSALESSRVMVDAAGSSAAAKSAALEAAETVNSYRMIRAPFGGVVTRRLLSPGVLVTPGTAILNIAQIDKVRIQADVSEDDIANIKIGSDVVVNVPKGGKTIRARVTSIAPLSDLKSRTAIVEAVIDNPGHFLVPGDSVSVAITTESSRDAITVPADAVVERDGREAVWTALTVEMKGEVTYTCPMHPQIITHEPGDCPICHMKLVPKETSTGKAAHLVYVKTGRSDGERTEIISGLSIGEEVIYAGNSYLREGDAVSPTDWGKDGPLMLPPPAGGADMSGHEGHDMDMTGKDN